MTCLSCGGDGWLRRSVPHPYVPGSTVTVTRVCEWCKGKGHVKEYHLCGKDKAANDTDENNPAQT